jgi:hypothetical protein
MTFRPRRRPTPNFKIPPPFNPVSGEHKNLEVPGIFPYCSMMQVAYEDKYGDYVMCRGFDTRILRFIDFEDGNPNKPGIAVAKPFGDRGIEADGYVTRKYRKGEIFPAFLTTQGAADDRVSDYVPPSPVAVKWRVGQNPGYVVGGNTFGGHPSALSNEVKLLKDHNDKVINWMLIHADTDKHFRFQSQATLSGESVDACIRQMSGTEPHIAPIFDPQGIFTDMESGTKGLVFFQGGRYYIVQAKCDPDELEPCEDE